MVQEKGRRHLKILLVLSAVCVMGLIAGCDPEKSRISETIKLKDDGTGTVTWEFYFNDAHIDIGKRFGLPITQAYAVSFAEERGLENVRFNKQELPGQKRKAKASEEGMEDVAEEEKKTPDPVWAKYTITASFKGVNSADASLNPISWGQVRGEDFKFSREFSLGSRIKGKLDEALQTGSTNEIDVALQESVTDLMIHSKTSLRGLILDKDVEPESSVIKGREHSTVSWTFSLKTLRKKDSLVGKFGAKILTKAQLDNRLLIVILLLCVLIIIYCFAQTIIRQKNAIPIAERRKRMREMQLAPEEPSAPNQP